MKKLLIILMACLMAFSFVGCVSYTGDGNNSGTKLPTDSQTPSTPSDEDETQPFTVQLTYNGANFSPSEDLYAIWTNSSSVYSAPFDKTGFATIDGLDGDYTVTLSARPTGYTYEPNIYSATNESKEVYIKLYVLSKYGDESGTKLTANDTIKINTTGAYRATLNSSSSVLYFQYEPKISGTYTFQSMIDVTANEINPILDIYTANKGGFYLFRETQDTGGSSNTYTKNFRWVIQLTQAEVGNVFGFAIRTESTKEDAFPIDIDFILERNGEFTSEEVIYKDISASNSFTQDISAQGSFNYLARETAGNTLSYQIVKIWDKDVKSNGIYGDGRLHVYNTLTGVYDTGTLAAGTYIRLNDKGFYCLYEYDHYDATYGVEVGTYGKVIYAKINRDTEVTETESGMGLLDDRVNLRFVVKESYGWTAIEKWLYEGDTKVYGGLNFRPMIEEYAQFVNGASAYPVTEELQIFLQIYAWSNRLFFDGNGYAELCGYNSDEDSMWLYGSGIYK